MPRSIQSICGVGRSCCSRPRALVLLAAFLGAVSGCAAMTNPVADGVPVRLLPPELLGRPKCEEHTIPLNLLRQPSSATYQLAPGDTLGVFIEGILGEQNLPIPMHVSPLVQLRDQRRLPPAAGYPVPVDEDGTIALPGAGKLKIQGLSLAEAREAIRALYVKNDVFKEGKERLLVTLLHPRQYQVLVLRQESANVAVGPEGLISSGKRGTGHLVELPANENDVLHALTVTGGLPGLDAYNEIVIYRDCFHNDQEGRILQQQLGPPPRGSKPLGLVDRGGQTIHIPLRLPPGAPLPIRPQDIILHTGDVVFLEARDTDLFYTGGLLPPGSHVLPRDYDLDVVEAVSLVRGPLFNGDFGGSNLSGNFISPGIGNPSPSLLVVLRRTPRCGQVPIVVNLKTALRKPQERILVQPGDLLILQEAPGEAFARYFTQTFLNFDVFWQAFHGKYATGIVDVAAPDRLPGRVGAIQVNNP